MTRQLLKENSAAIAESMGVRSQRTARPPVVPIANPREVGVRPLANAVSIEVNRVQPDPSQPRKHFCADHLQRLANSIADRGQLSPILVRWSDEYDDYVIVAGERRWRATQLAGLTHIQCVVSNDEDDPSQLLEQQLIENCLREDLTVIEEANGYRRLMELNGCSAKHLADKLHVSETRISRSLAMLKLPEPVLEEVERGAISARAAYELSRIKQPDLQAELALRASTGQLSASEIRKSVRSNRVRKPRRQQQRFVTAEGWTVVASSKSPSSYAALEASLQECLDEVRHRIRNRCSLY